MRHKGSGKTHEKNCRQVAELMVDGVRNECRCFPEEGSGRFRARPTSITPPFLDILALIQASEHLDDWGATSSFERLHIATVLRLRPFWPPCSGCFIDLWKSEVILLG